MENSSVARKATKLRIGPWYVLQSRNPAAPGMKWETLLNFIRKGRIKPQSIVRGPTTHQLWRFAAHVKGLSREFGVCHGCGAGVDRAAAVCAHCNRPQDPPANPDALLEGADGEARSAVFRELAPSETSAQLADVPGSSTSAMEPAVDVEQIEQRVAERLAALEAEQQAQREAAALEREELQRLKDAAAHDREEVRRQLDATAREREAASREREALTRERRIIDKDRAALQHERESMRREFEALTTLRDRQAGVAAPAAKPNMADTAASVWGVLDNPHDRPVTPPRGFSEPADRSTAGNGAAQKPRPRDGGFLSAKDLAAAFKLNLATPIPDDLFGPTSPVATLDTPAPPSPHRSAAGAILVLVILAVGLAAGIVALPDVRHQLFGNSSSPGAGVPFKPILPPTRSHDDRSTTDLPPDPPSPLTPPNPANPSTPSASSIPKDNSTLPPATIPNLILPATAPALVAATAPNSTPPLAAVSQAPPTTEPAPALASTTQPTTATADSGLDPTAAALVQSLYRRASAAEVSGDFAQAAKLLQQIHNFPSDYWPSDLEMRLKLARTQESGK